MRTSHDWTLPRTLAGGVLHAIAARECAAGPAQPASAHRDCELAQYPVIFGAASTTYTCGDGVYHAPADPVQGTRPFSRALARGLGFATGAAPAQWNVDASGLPLSVLQAGAAVFGTGVGTTCPGLQRCPGFVTPWTSTPIEASSREEAFAFALEKYIQGGFRAQAREDRAAATCNDLLVRKYLWLRDNVFHGYEYGRAADERTAMPLTLCP